MPSSRSASSRERTPSRAPGPGVMVVMACAQPAGGSSSPISPGSVDPAWCRAHSSGRRDQSWSQ
eukprot:scaffold61257_cov34-Tisochrysis_lutea.AAC.8